jgi:putative membrane protein insertion efficiency factor
MGHCDSPTQFGRHGEFCSADRGPAEADSSRNDSGNSQATSVKPRSASRWVLLALLRFYKAFLSPFFGGACKYYPSCSTYTYQAVERHGARRGLELALKRLLRCRPFTPGGFDPVPGAEEMNPDPVGPGRAESVR